MADNRVYKVFPGQQVNRQTPTTEQDKSDMKTTMYKFFELFNQKHL